MIQQFRQRQFSASNPLANALVVIVGVIVIGLSIVLGVVAFVALLAAAVVLGAVIAVRVWWLNRKLGRASRKHAGQARRQSAGSEIIEGEYHVVTREKERRPGR